MEAQCRGKPILLTSERQLPDACLPQNERGGVSSDGRFAEWVNQDSTSLGRPAMGRCHHERTGSSRHHAVNGAVSMGVVGQRLPPNVSMIVLSAGVDSWTIERLCFTHSEIGAAIGQNEAGGTSSSRRTLPAASSCRQNCLSTSRRTGREMSVPPTVGKASPAYRIRPVSCL